MRLTELEKQALEATSGGEAWNRVVGRVKRSRGGEYPDDWAVFAFGPGGIIERKRAAGVVEFFAVEAGGWDELIDKCTRLK